MGTVQYHLDRLEKMGKVNSTRHGLYKYYFPVRISEENQKNLLQVLSQETAREILMIIIERKDPTQIQIANRIGISSAAVNWQIRRLVDMNILKEFKEGRYKRYHLNRNPQHILALLRSYYPNIWDKWSNRLIELFLSFSDSSQET